MSVTESDLILHHYGTSIFSEKIRLAFGLKGLNWHSVEVSDIMPRPHLMPLTGGFRKIPVLQIGADIFCDTQIILREIERRHPQPALLPAQCAGLAHGLAMWTDRVFFQTSVALIFGTIGDAVPDEFKKDREQLSGQPFNTELMKSSVPMMKDQWRAQAAWLNAQLSADAPFLFGDAPTLADIHAHMNVWFVHRTIPEIADALTSDLVFLNKWFDRLNAVGHGRKYDLTPEAALELAIQTTPKAPDQRDQRDPNGRKPGDRVTVMADDYGKDPIAGVLVSSSDQHITIRRRDESAGEVNVHFPKTGFLILPN